MVDLSRSKQGQSIKESTLVGATCQSSGASVGGPSLVGRRLNGEEDPFFGREVCLKSGALTGLMGTIVGSLEGNRLLIAIKSEQQTLFLAIDQLAVDLAQAVP